MSELTRRLVDLSPEKREQVLQKIRERRTAHEEKPSALQEPSIVPVSRTAPIRLSYAQRRLWFLDQMEGPNPHYNEFGGQWIEGRLNVTALENSLTEIVRRHEILRTTFPLLDGEPIQHVHSPAPVPLPLEDLSTLSEPQQLDEVDRRADAEANLPYDLAVGPLLRIRLLRLAAERHVLFVTLHHIVCDNWSSAIFIHELGELYQAFASGKPSPLPDLPIQYADFSAWQHSWLQGEVLKTQLAYWKRHLARLPAPLELPLDRPRSERPSFEGCNVYFEFDAAITRKLKSISQESGATLFMTLLAAYASLLARYSAQEDMLIGVPIANRNRRELEPLIGFFVNTLLFRIDLKGNPSFRDLLHRVREVTLGGYTHQDLPLDKLVESLQEEKVLSRNALFRVMFIFQNAPVTEVTLPGLRLIRLEKDSGAVRSDLDGYMHESAQKLRGSLRYNTSLFDEATVRRMTRRFQRLVEQVSSNPELTLDDLQLEDPSHLPPIASILHALQADQPASPDFMG